MSVHSQATFFTMEEGKETLILPFFNFSVNFCFRNVKGYFTPQGWGLVNILFLIKYSFVVKWTNSLEGEKYDLTKKILDF